jgi:tetratricopeptide (TPR) repeat protein
VKGPVENDIPAPRVGTPRPSESWRRARITRYAVGSLATVAVLALVAAGVVNLTTSRPDAMQASAYMSAGMSAQRQGLVAVARDDYRLALAHEPRNKYAYYNLGTIDSQQRHTVLAMEDYEAALTFDGSFAPALDNLAILLTPAHPLQAVTLYQRATQAAPGDADAHLNLGLLLHRLGRDGKARVEFATALRLNPTLRARIPPGLRPPQ